MLDETEARSKDRSPTCFKIMKWKISLWFHPSVVCELLEWLFLHFGGEPMMSFVRFSRQEQTPWRLWDLRRADEPQISIVTIAIMYVCLCMFINWLVVCNMFLFFPYIGNNHPNWRPHIFQRGRYTTNQYHLYHCWISELTMDFQHLPAVKSKLSSTRPLYLARPGGWKDSWHRSGGAERKPTETYMEVS